MLAGLILCVLIFASSPGRLFKNPTSFVIEDADGNLLNASIAADGQWRFPYSEDISQKFIDCIITFEDKRFFNHPGIDAIAIARSAWANVRHGATVQGGSTISMQVARLASKHTNRGFWNKMKETLLALRLELTYSKKEIIALYAANAPFGSNVVGLDAAAWRYFGRSADKLSWGEMATLAVLPNAPSLVHPGRNRETLLVKRNLLLDKLVTSGKINADICSLAKLEPLPVKPLPLPQDAPHLLQRYKNEAHDAVNTKIISTIDGNLQRDVTRIIATTSASTARQRHQ